MILRCFLLGLCVVLMGCPREPRPPMGMVFAFEEGVDGYAGFEDTTLFEELPTRSGGGIDGVFAGTIRTGFLRRALIRVDLSSILPGSVVESVRLELVVERTGENSTEGTYGLHFVTTDWGEGAANVPGSPGGVGAPAEEGDATWTDNFFMVSEWDHPGGDFDPMPSSVAPAGRAGFRAVWTSADMAADVQHWIDHPEENFGWMIVSQIEGVIQRTQKYFSSEAMINRPRLIVELAPELR